MAARSCHAVVTRPPHASSSSPPAIPQPPDIVVDFASEARGRLVRPSDFKSDGGPEYRSSAGSIPVRFRHVTPFAAVRVALRHHARSIDASRELGLGGRGLEQLLQIAELPAVRAADRNSIPGGLALFPIRLGRRRRLSFERICGRKLRGSIGIKV